MLTAFTSTSIRVQLSSKFIGKHGMLYLFCCTLNVENHSQQPIILLGKHWFIHSNQNGTQEIIGEGFNGEFPLLLPKARFTYDTILPLHTVFASIDSHYTLCLSDDSKNTFDVNAPTVDLTPKPFLN